MCKGASRPLSSAIRFQSMKQLPDVLYLAKGVAVIAARFIFTEGAKVGKIAGEFNQAANDLAKAAATGDAAAVKTAFGAVGGTCKSCHDDYRAK